MTKREQTIEVIRALDDGMEQIQTTRDIWQNELLYWICKGLKLLLEASLKGKTEVMAQCRMSPRDIIDLFMESGERYMEIDTTKWATTLSAYGSFKQCIRNKRIKDCQVHLKDNKIYLFRN